MNPNEPQPPPSDQKPPAWLKGAKARRAWRALAPVLGRMQILTEADEVAVGLLCDAFAEWQECRAVIRKHGRTYQTTTQTGDTMIRPRPEVADAADAWRRVKAMLTEYGLTAASRAKVSAPSAKEDDLDALLHGTG
jgi:P27 family predicted phage terminase small subunit